MFQSCFQTQLPDEKHALFLQNILGRVNCTRSYLVSNSIRWWYSLDNVIEPVRNSYVLNDITLMDDMLNNVKEINIVRNTN